MRFAIERFALLLTAVAAVLILAPDISAAKRRVSILYIHYSVGTGMVNGYCWGDEYNRNITETLDTMTITADSDTARIMFRSYRINGDYADNAISDSLPGSGSNGCAFDRFTGFGYDLDKSVGNRMRIWNDDNGMGVNGYAGLLNLFFNVPNKEDSAFFRMFRTHDIPSSFGHDVTETDGFDLVIIKQPYATHAYMTQAQADSIKVLYRAVRDSIVAHPEINVALAFGTPHMMGRFGINDSTTAKITYDLATWFASGSFFTHDTANYPNLWKWDSFRYLCEMSPDSANRYCLKNEYFDGEPVGSHLSLLGYSISQDSLVAFIRRTVGDIMGAESGEDPDTDGDGIIDAEDNCPGESNPGQENSDGDTWGDACDNCPDDDNQAQTDDDDDGYGDACDVCPGYDDGQDSDGDGVPDSCDNCPDVDNQSQNNDDGDSYGNECDNCPGTSNSDQANSDGDTWGDACDNCPDDTNQSQADDDGDSYGNECDLCPEYDDDADGDTDGVPDGCDECPGHDDNLDSDVDGVANGCDNCPTESNVSQSDSDGDAVGDACDECEGYDDYEDPDSDGVPDSCDNCPGLYNPSQADEDNDGIGDLCELPLDTADEDLPLPDNLRLDQNYPNPFNPVTAISFELPRAMTVKLQVYGVDGRLVDTPLNATMSAGSHTVYWNGVDDSGRPVASGVYFYRLLSPDFSLSRKMLLLR